MNEKQKEEFVKELKENHPSIYKNMNIDDAVKIHKLRKARGKE